MGAAVCGTGATFREGPNADPVYVVLNAGASYTPNSADEAVRTTEGASPRPALVRRSASSTRPAEHAAPYADSKANSMQ
jgi:hypothetical protein